MSHSSINKPKQCVCKNKSCTIPYGLCHCGCGGTAPIAPHNSVKRNMMVGEPLMFIWQHHRKKYSGNESLLYKEPPIKRKSGVNSCLACDEAIYRSGRSRQNSNIRILDGS